VAEISLHNLENIRLSVLKAASDPQFQADMMDVRRAFEHSDFEKGAA